MRPELFLTISAGTLLVAIVTLLLNCLRRKAGRDEDCVRERRRWIFEADSDRDLANEITLVRRVEAREPKANFLSRRRFLPSVVAGLAALIIARTTNREARVVLAAEKASGEVSGASRENHTDTHTDRTPHIDQHYDVTDNLGHSDTHTDQNNHFDSHTDTDS